jgi:polyisoprenoid-binding protein YceI
MQTARLKSDTQTVWAIDPAYSTVEFNVKKFFFGTLKGRFTEIEGNIVLDQLKSSNSSVEVAVKAASIDTGNKRRDADLRSAGFLEVDRYQDIRFESTSVEPGTDRDTLRLTGALTIKGKSREIILDVDKLDHSRSPDGQEVLYYSTQTGLDRLDFGIGRRLGAMGRSVKVIVNVQANRVDQ